MREGLPDRRARPRAHRHHEGEDGPRGAVDHENCLNHLGLRCDICYRVCPVIDKAITLEPQNNPRTGKHALFIPMVHADACTGCGKCEKACALRGGGDQGAAGRAGQGRARRALPAGLEGEGQGGRALVPAEPEHRYNLPEGLRYEPAGRELAVRARARRRRAHQAGLGRKAVSSAAPARVAPRRWPPRAGGARTAGSSPGAPRRSASSPCSCRPLARRVDRQGQPRLEPHARRAAAHRPVRAAAVAARGPRGRWPSIHRRGHRAWLLPASSAAASTAAGCARSTPSPTSRPGCGGGWAGERRCVSRQLRYWLLGVTFASPRGAARSRGSSSIRCRCSTAA